MQTTVAQAGKAWAGFGRRTGEGQVSSLPGFLRSPGCVHPCSPLSELLRPPLESAVTEESLSKYSRRATTREGGRGARKAAGRCPHGDPGAAQVSLDKYCPFVSADCRDQQTDELIIIIIIIILIIHIPKGGKSDTGHLCMFSIG